MRQNTTHKDMECNVLVAQIGAGNLMAVGARSFVRSAGMLRFQVGKQTAGRRCWIEIRLSWKDFYDVKFIEMDWPTATIVGSEEVEDVDDTQIGAVVRRLGDR